MTATFVFGLIPGFLLIFLFNYLYNLHIFYLAISNIDVSSLDYKSVKVQNKFEIFKSSHQVFGIIHHKHDKKYYMLALW